VANVAFKPLNNIGIEPDGELLLFNWFEKTACDTESHFVIYGFKFTDFLEWFFWRPGVHPQRAAASRVGVEEGLKSKKVCDLYAGTGRMLDVCQ
jgi:hypothetical protein